MTDDELEKYFDKLIFKIKNSREFNVLKTLKSEIDVLNLEPKPKNDLAKSIADFGINRGLVDVINSSTGWYKLTDKGLRLKQSNLTLNKFLKKESKSKWYNENWIGFIIAFIVLLFSVFQYFDNRTLAYERDFAKSQLDSCKSELSVCTDKLKTEMKLKE